MPAARFYVTTTIPYVNARPHLGFALELVQADVLARHRRQRGDEVRSLMRTLGRTAARPATPIPEALGASIPKRSRHVCPVSVPTC
jgi:hypothetical protein